ncbi:multiple epidermal growth factor-like domains protein 10, partial [Mercenaria mercenaria]|uniref:multiple epidermal growth factor-like domains protein 10 n=1 Tax=Mercenaria mercenaria TaxID=6596 RepID=UPI00234F6F66
YVLQDVVGGGINCANACGDCVSGNCRHTDGVCDGGCAAGVKSTPHCDEECHGGSYGINCSGVCSNTCKDVCRKQTGECKYCKSGWHGANCTLECKDGSWGENCKRTCLTCRNETCNRINGACYSQCKPGFKQTEYCDQECSSGWYGLNCSEECTRNCKDVTFCRKTDGSCIECKPGLEGKICDQAVQQKETMMHISGGGIAAIVVTFIVLIFFSVVVTVFISRKRLHIKHNKFENETVSYSNVLAAETSGSVLKTPESNLNVEMENVYDIIKRTSGIEHT